MMTQRSLEKPSPAESSGHATATREKIKELEVLAELIEAHKIKGEKVVLCHGVFDLLHVGHIRHFEEAKKNGMVLVVTLTPDHLVNKGPLRPTFTQTLRAEAIAALDCVGYVGVSRWPMAIDLIKLLRPDFYVKGSDYKVDEEDVTGGIALERDAVESVGGRLVFTDEVVFSSSELINRHLPTLSDETQLFLRDFSNNHSANDVVSYFEKMRGLKVLIVGETIVDEYRYCRALGKSAKAPTLAVKVESSETFAGGILAVGNNVANFSNYVGLLSIIGDDEGESSKLQSNINQTIDAHLLRRSQSPTIKKTRFIDSISFSKLFEVYDINDQALSNDDNKQLCASLERLVPEYDAVIVVDFGHSMLTREAADILCQKARFLAINVQSNAGNLGYQTVSKFKRADYICLTENEARLEARDRTGELQAIVENLADQLSSARVSITRGSNGCLCYGQQDGFYNIPSVTGRVVDSIGAGDSFLAITSLAAVLNAPTDVLGFIGNVIAAQAVATVGHRESINPVTSTKFITSLLK